MRNAPSWLKTPPGRAQLAVYVQPGAARNAVVGTHGERLKIAVRAAPSDGAANAAVLVLIAAQLQLSLRNVCLLTGAHSRAKRIEVITDLSATAIAAALLKN
jgi:uncharacterized protein (TIGR00251 family)